MGTAAWLIFRKEWLDVVRDRRAVFLAFVLPVLLYPILFLSFSALSRSRTEKAALHAGFSGDYLSFLPRLADKNVVAEERELDPQDVRGGEIALFLKFDGSRATVYYSATSSSSMEALRRIRSALEEHRDSLIERRFEEAGRDLDPARVAVFDAVDVSTPEERSAVRLGRFLPLFLVLLLLSGGAFAALDLVAGEKERGTLETLYIHPVSARSIVWGKFFVVLGLSVVSLLFNLAGLRLTIFIGGFIGLEPEVLGGGPLLLPPASVLALVLIITAPLAVLTSAILLAVSTFARSFREAQTYFLPVTLAAMALTALAISPHATLSSAVAVVPIANAALAVREAIEGRLLPLPFAVAFLTSAAYAWVALRKAASLLEREDLVLGLEPPALLEDATAEGRSRRAVVSASCYLLLLYFTATWLQAQALIPGLAITLWVLVLLPALAYPVFVKAPWRATLGLEAPSLRSLVLAIVIAASAAVLVSAYMNFQGEFLPVPDAMREAGRKLMESNDLSFWLGILLFAVSPGICEELLWRGAFQGELEPRGRPLRTALTVGLFFGIFHFDIYRLIPTAALGAVLSIVRRRSGSIVPCMLTHAAYNGALYAGLRWFGEANLDRLIASPTAIVVAALALVLSVKGLGSKSLVRAMEGP